MYKTIPTYLSMKIFGIWILFPCLCFPQQRVLRPRSYALGVQNGQDIPWLTCFSGSSPPLSLPERQARTTRICTCQLRLRGTRVKLHTVSTLCTTESHPIIQLEDARPLSMEQQHGSFSPESAGNGADRKKRRIPVRDTVQHGFGSGRPGKG